MLKRRPIGPVVANRVIGYLDWKGQTTLSSLALYSRYVDGLFTETKNERKEMQTHSSYELYLKLISKLD